jgi:hypothetical protein
MPDLLARGSADRRKRQSYGNVELDLQPLPLSATGSRFLRVLIDRILTPKGNMPLTRLISILTAAFLLAAAPAFAKGDQGSHRRDLLPPVLGTAPYLITHDLTGLALDGFDPVSYFLEGEPRPGRAEYEAIWGGAAWRFASAANRAAFISHPPAYAPRFGGHDALAMAGGRAVPASPRIASVVDRRLYLFRSDQARAAFLADRDAVYHAEARWSETSARLVRE